MVAGATPPPDGSALILSLRRMNRLRSIERREPARGRRGRRDPRRRSTKRARRSRHALSADPRRARQRDHRRSHLDQCRRHPGAALRDDARAGRGGRGGAARRLGPQRPVGAQEGQSRLQPRPVADRRRRHARRGHRGRPAAGAGGRVARGRLGRGRHSGGRAGPAALPRGAHATPSRASSWCPQDSLELVLRHIPGTARSARRRAPVARADRGDHRRSGDRHRRRAPALPGRGARQTGWSPTR